LLPDKQTGLRIEEKSAAFLSLWGLPGLASSIDTRFYNRLRTSLGRAHPHTRMVQLNSVLLSADIRLLDEVLCHELAPIAVHVRFGSKAKPHGVEWAALMRQAGFRPRARISIEEEKLPIRVKTYEHLCPVCRIVRHARRPMYRWRCVRCFDAGRGGKLQIRSIGAAK